MKTPENDLSPQRTWTFLFCLLFFGPFSTAQTKTELPTVFDLIQREGVIEVNLNVNIDSILLNRRTKERIPGLFEFTDQLGQMFSWDVEINVRGNFRRIACDFPPLKLNFKKRQLGEHGLDEHNNLKLVTHCVNDWRGEDYLLREYLAYRMYQTLTDSSYRVQLLRINYRNTANGKSFTRYGFILEDEKELADRLDCALCEDCYSVPKEALLPEQTMDQALFQYMIGNADWEIKTLRNLKLLQPEDGGKYFVIPYDFDFSGLVNPYYAVPHPSLGIHNVSERIYLGFPQTAQHFEKAYSKLLAHKEELLSCIDNFEHLKRASRKDLRRYIESFYKTMDKEAPEFKPLVSSAQARDKR